MGILPFGNGLTFGELACFSCFLETVFLTFFHSWITGKQTCTLQYFSVVCIYIQQCSGNAVTNSSGLTCTAAALDVGNYVISGGGSCQFQRLFNNQFKSSQIEVILQIAAIDCNITLSRYQSEYSRISPM